MEYQLAELQWINLNNMTYEEGLRRLVKALAKGAETTGVAPDQNVEKRRSDTARLRQILEEGAAHSPERPPDAAPPIDDSTPAVTPRVEAAPKSSTVPASSLAPPSPAEGKKSPLIPAVIAGAVLLAAGGGYAIYRSSSSAAPEPTPTPTPAPESAATLPSSDPNPSTKPRSSTSQSQLGASPDPRATPTPAASDNRSASLIAATRRNIDLLAAGKTADISKIAGNISSEKMLNLWNGVVANVGSFKRVVDMEVGEGAGGAPKVRAKCEFESGAIRWIMMTYGKRGEVNAFAISSKEMAFQ
jgi:hypothetical protein